VKRENAARADVKRAGARSVRYGSAERATGAREREMARAREGGATCAARGAAFRCRKTPPAAF